MNVFTDWLDQFFDELTPHEFYRTIFPEGELDERDAMTKGKYTGIIIEVTDEKRKVIRRYKDGSSREVEEPVVLRHTVTNGLEEIDEVLQRGNFCLMPPISYAGKKRSAENARNLYAIAIDLDDLRRGKNGEPNGLIDLWNGHVQRVKRIPQPTMIVSSGTGLHLYYVFESAVPLFPNIARQLQQYKHELTRLCWNEGIVDIKNDNEIQYEGIYQGFRMPGTITKAGKLTGSNERARCFLTGDKVTVEYMNSFVEEKYQITEYAYKSKLTKAEAQERYPEWYEERIVKGNKNVLHPWALNRNVYDWWLRQIHSGAKVRHRYWCLWILAIYAKKCSFYDPKKNPDPVTQEELEHDAWGLMEFLDRMTDTEDNHFTEIDVIEALEAFEDRFISYPKASIRYKANIPFEPSVRRNYQKQEWHLEDCRSKKENMKRRGQAFKRPEGRPQGSGTAQKTVQEWKWKNPEGRKIDCERETGLSRHTVLRWWDSEDMEMVSKK